jgi:hypothetical protein
MNLISTEIINVSPWAEETYTKLLNYSKDNIIIDTTSNKCQAKHLEKYIKYETIDK